MTAIDRARRQQPPPTAWSPRYKLGALLAVFAAAAAAAFSGLSVGSHSTGTVSKLLVILPIALAFGLGLTVLALTQFKVFLMVLLVVRASVDVTKVTSRAGGSTIPNTGSHSADPSSMIAVLLILAGVLWLAAQRHHNGSLRGGRLRTALVVMVLAGFASVLGDNHPLTSVVESLRVLSVVVMFSCLEQLMADERSRRQLIFAILSSAIFPLAFTILGFASGHPRTELKGGFTRIVGTFHQSNDYGRYLMLIIIFGAAVYPHLSERQRRWLAVGMAPSSVFLILTYTRTALIGTIVGLVIVGVYQSKRLLKGLAVVCVFSLALVPSLASRFGSVASSSALSANSASAHSGDSFSWRLSYWTEVLPLANKNPATGIGLGETQYNTAQAKAPHNDYIRAYVETGVLGLMAYLAMLFGLLRVSRRAIRVAKPGTFDYGVAVGTFACAVAYVLVSAAANVLSSVEILWYLFGFAAASSAIVAQSRVRVDIPNGVTPGPLPTI